MFLGCEDFRLCIKVRKVFIVFGREIMKDLRQVKSHVSNLGIRCNEALWKRYALRNSITEPIRFPLNVRGLKQRVQTKIRRTRQRDAFR